MADRWYSRCVPSPALQTRRVRSAPAAGQTLAARQPRSRRGVNLGAAERGNVPRVSGSWANTFYHIT
eukprot:1774999-Prymnesium_polylepis.1